MLFGGHGRERSASERFASCLITVSKDKKSATLPQILRALPRGARSIRQNLKRLSREILFVFEHEHDLRRDIFISRNSKALFRVTSLADLVALRLRGPAAALSRPRCLFPNELKDAFLTLRGQHRRRRSCLPTMFRAIEIGGGPYSIDWADMVVACMDGPDPDSGTAWKAVTPMSRASRATPTGFGHLGRSPLRH